MVAPLSTGASGPVHGALLRGGAYSDVTGFDPVITRPTNDWEAGATEAQTCLSSFWPAELGTTNTLDSNGVLQQTFVAIPGQFRCAITPPATVKGVQRNFSSMTFELLRCPSADTVPPAVRRIDLRTLPGGAVGVTVDAADDSGIARIVVLRFDSGVVTPVELNVPLTTSGTFNITLPNVDAANNLVVQVQDGACNVTTATAKGSYMTAIPVDAGPDQILAAGGAPNTFTAKISRFSLLVAPVFYDWDFGDGAFLSGLVSPSNTTVDPSDTATLTIQRVIPGGTQTPFTAKVRITDAAGGIGVDDLSVRSDSLGDAPSADSDLVGSGMSNDATTMTIAVRVAGVISSKVQYRLTLDIGAAEFKLRCNGGALSGPPSLRATVNGGELLLTFNLSDIGVHPGDVVNWFVQTQSGVPGAPSAGFPDQMPDTGFLTYTVR